MLSRCKSGWDILFGGSGREARYGDNAMYFSRRSTYPLGVCGESIDL